MDQYFAITMFDGCMGWFGALILVVVGLVVSQKGDTAAGFGVAAAGLVKILVNCCAMSPTLAFRYGMVDIDPMVFDVNSILIQLQRLAFFGILAFAVTRLSTVPEQKS